MKRIVYVFPETENFREERPRICWEHMYGWIDGYGVLFDPVIQSRFEEVPEWSNGTPKELGEDDFVITSCAQATAELADLNIPGILIRPKLDDGAILAHRLSEKERLTTPVENLYYPLGLPFDYYAAAHNGSDGEKNAWMLGEAPAVIADGGRVSVAFELFSMLWGYSADWPEKRLPVWADMIAAILADAGIASAESSGEKSAEHEELRIDFQSYGINRLFIQWLMKLNDVDPEVIGKADGAYLHAVAMWEADETSAAITALGAAFASLAEIRKSVSKLEMNFLDYPHLGILMEDKGFFEIEWPEATRKTIISFLDQIEKHGYKASFEAGGACWENLKARFPEMSARLAEAWNSGGISLTNGTLTLPYALVSPLGLQYLQFAEGAAAFERTFGRKPDTYQCQENSLTPQMPELLNHFGYKRALHITQNHGQAPSEDVDFIQWTSPGGHSIPAMTARDVKLSRKGGNYFLDIALVHNEFKNDSKPLNYVNFQDISYVPYRIQMIRAHKYADVWGKYVLDEERFEAAYDSSEAPRKTYFADDYKLSDGAFYPNETNVNSISHYEKVFTLWNRFRSLQIMAYEKGRLGGAGEGGAMFARFAEIVPDLCLIEAHDCAYVQGQRRGEFSALKLIDTAPYSRETLSEEMTKKFAEIAEKLDSMEFAIFAEAPRGVPESSSVSGARVFKSTEFPVDFADWKFDLDDSGRLLVSKDGSTVVCAPIDRKKGTFELIDSKISTIPDSTTIRMNYMLSGDSVQTVLMEVKCLKNANVAEFDLRYAPRGDFDAKVKWSDYLAVEVDCGAPLEKVWRFNPNVLSETRENRVASPCFLSVETKVGKKFSILNEGAFLYELDRGIGKVNWLAHVACETVHKRGMAILFGDDEPLSLARSWSAERNGLPIRTNSDSPLFEFVEAHPEISFECFSSPTTVLISNLTNREITLPAPANLSIANLAGVNIVRDGNLNLKPFELALANMEGTGGSII